MVKSFEEELAGRAAVLAFCQISSSHSEDCIRAAGSIAQAGIEAGHQVDFQNLNEGRRLRIQPYGDNSRLLEELARYNTSTGEATAEKLASAITQISRRSAIHFVLTGLDSALESEINRLINAQKLVVLHVPPGTRVNLDCAVHHFPVS